MQPRPRLIAILSLALSSGMAVAQPPPAGDPAMRGGPGPGVYGLLQFDTNSDGKLTRAELNSAIRARFDRMDSNHDGTATPEELRAFGESEKIKRRNERATSRFRELDKDRNGQISLQEFQAAEPPRGERGQGGEPPAPIQGKPMMDDGAAHKRPGSHDGPGHRGPQDGANRGPGQGRRGIPSEPELPLTFADISERPLELFNRVDANNDGTVTIAELQQFSRGRP